MISLALSILTAVWNSQAGRYALIGGGLFLFGWVKGFGYADVDGSVRRAVAARDSHWTQQINEANANHEREISEAIAAAERAERDDPTPVDRGRLASLCQRDPYCADRKTGR